MSVNVELVKMRTTFGDTGFQKKKKSLNLKCIYFERKHTAILEEDTTLADTAKRQYLRIILIC